MSKMIVGFNYAVVKDLEARELARGNAEQIHAVLERTTSGIIEIGRRLIAVRSVLGREFRQWVLAEFRWSESVACNFIKAAETFGELKCVDQFKPTALFELMRTGVATAAVTEAVKLAERGETVTRKTAKRLVIKHAKPGAAKPAPDAIFRIRQSVRRFIPDLDAEQRERLAVALEHLAEELRLPGHPGTFERNESGPRSEAARSRRRDLAPVPA